jgi:hypothetical protein
MGGYARRTFVAAVAAAVLAAATASGATAAPPDQADGFEILSRDVFVIYGQNLLNPIPESQPDEPLYNLAAFDLGVTWGQWSAATAASRATRLGGRTDIRISAQGLVPGGIYSVFFFTIGPDTEQPLCPGVERMLPVDRFQKPGTNAFVADAAGGAAYRGEIAGDPLSATQFVIQLVYHADGQTYYPFPNRGEFLTQGPNCRSSFGHDAMRHLLIGQKFVV